MNRYSVTTQYGTMHLYYPTIEAAKESYPDAIIEPYDDTEHLKYIELLKANFKFIGNDYKGRFTYMTELPMGILTFKLSLMDNEYLDFCQYQFMAIGSLTYPVGWTLSTPKEVYEKFFTRPKYTELSWCCKSKGQKLAKPKELKGIKQICSVSFSKAKCPVYIVGNDLYINHHDYFSPSLKVADEDMGAPLSVLVKKYCGKSRATKFIYDDAWGDIVLQNIAWLKFENILPWIKSESKHTVALWMRDEVFKHLGFKNNEGGYAEWERFFENVYDNVKELMK